MRPASAAPAQPAPAGKYASMDERDARLEESYVFDRCGERSTMAFVSVYLLELVEEFFAFREREYQLHRTEGEGVFDSLRRWERGRFGAQLPPVEHGLIAFRVRCKLAPEHGGRVLPPGYLERTPRPVKALPADLSKAAGTMPRARMTKRQVEERVRMLEGQAEPMRAEGEPGGEG